MSRLLKLNTLIISLFFVVVLSAAVAQAKTENLKDFSNKGFITESDLSDVVFEFTNTTYKVMNDDYVSIPINTNLTDTFADVEVSCSDTSVVYDSGVSLVNKGVSIFANQKGSTTIKLTAKVTYCDSEGLFAGEKTYSCQAVINVMPLLDVKVDVGETITLDAHEYEVYNGYKYQISSSAFSVSGPGIITATSWGYGSIYLVGSGVNGERRVYLGEITAETSVMHISETEVYRAIGSPAYALSIQSLTAGSSVTWSSSNPNVCKVDAAGSITPIAVGDSVVTATIVKLSGAKVAFTCVVHITNPVLSKSTATVALNNSITLSVSGTKGKAVWATSDNKIVSVGSDYSSYYSWDDDSDTSGTNGLNANVYGLKKGKAMVTVNIDGIALICKVTVSDPKISKSFVLLAKGSKQVIKVSGAHDSKHITYTSSNKSVATVSASGVVKAKKAGFAVITVSADGAKFTVSVNVGNKKAVKAVLNALKVEGSKYSQAKRMSKGYYDCSSLIWRSYAPVGYKFGASGYAPVAAAEASYLVRNKKTVSVKYKYKLNKLQPGDLFFFQGARNGRFKNIYHVAIYMGQEASSYFGETYTYGKIIHANGAYVSQGYMYNIENIVVIGRPTK